MLPAPAVFHFPWEVNSGAVKEGGSVRTFGRCGVCLPQDVGGTLIGENWLVLMTEENQWNEESKATLSAQNAATQHQVVVQTTFVEPFEPIIGAQYLVVGEIENSEGGDGVMVRARVLNCVDGLNLALLQRAVNEQRSYFRERMESKGDAPP